MSILWLDENILNFILFGYLDDLSLVKLSLSCKTLFKLIERNEDTGTCIWNSKLNNYLDLFLQNKVPPLIRPKNYYVLDDENTLNLINERISKFVKVYQTKMFYNLQDLNFFPFTLQNNINIYKLKYFLLKHKFIFKEPNLNKNYISPTDIYPYYNNYHTLSSLDQSFWRTFYSNLTLQPNQIYYCCILLSHYDHEHYENAWDLLIGIEPNIKQSFIDAWLSQRIISVNKVSDRGFGYCVKSDALVENGISSYAKKDSNKGGDCIGVKIDFTNENVISLTFYLNNNLQRNFEKKVKSKMEYKFVVSVVKNVKLITLFPWDGNIENLRYE